jgi:hypothetical protein
MPRLNPRNISEHKAEPFRLEFDGKARAVFMADSWSDGARIFRVLEGPLGRTVETQYGRFPTWTEANSFAMQLNDKLGIGPVEARLLSNSAMMCNSLHALACSHLALSVSPSHFVANAAGVQTLIARLTLALTFCILDEWRLI